MLDSSQEGDKVVKPDTQYSSHHETMVYGKKKNIVMISRSPEKVHNKTGWKHSRNAVYWIHRVRAQEKGMTFWQTKSHAITTNSTLPTDCLERVISQRGEMTVCQRSSTPRLAPRIVLKNAWHEQQPATVAAAGCF